jgi:hypothetical protein
VAEASDRRLFAWSYEGSEICPVLRVQCLWVAEVTGDIRVVPPDAATPFTEPTMLLAQRCAHGVVERMVGGGGHGLDVDSHALAR